MFCGDPSRNTEQAFFYCVLICLRLLTCPETRGGTATGLMPSSHRWHRQDKTAVLSAVWIECATVAVSFQYIGDRTVLSSLVRGVNAFENCLQCLRLLIYYQCKKTSQFKTRCKGDISCAFKTAKISVFDTMMCRRPDVPLQTELLAFTIQLRTSQPSILAVQFKLGTYYV